MSIVTLPPELNDRLVLAGDKEIQDPVYAVLVIVDHTDVLDLRPCGTIPRFATKRRLCVHYVSELSNRMGSNPIGARVLWCLEL
jgi:hypothetical protein